MRGPLVPRRSFRPAAAVIKCVIKRCPPQLPPAASGSPPPLLIQPIPFAAPLPPPPAHFSVGGGAGSSPRRPVRPPHRIPGLRRGGCRPAPRPIRRRAVRPGRGGGAGIG